MQVLTRRWEKGEEYQYQRIAYFWRIPHDVLLIGIVCEDNIEMLNNGNGDGDDVP